MSTAMTVLAPLMAAAWMAFRPTPPQPRTTTLVPGLTLAAFTTDPNPVMTPQPMRHADEKGMLLLIFTTACCLTSVCVAMVPRWNERAMGVPLCRVLWSVA